MEQEAFMRFRRALRRSDQIALDDLFVSAQKHLAAAAYAAHALPLETFMLSMLLEEHKEVQRLRRQMDEITGQLPAGEERMLLDEEIEGEDTPEAEPVEAPEYELASVPHGDISRAGIEAMHVVEAKSDPQPAAPRQARGTDITMAEQDIPEGEPFDGAHGFDRLSHRVGPGAERDVPEGEPSEDTHGFDRLSHRDGQEEIDADPS